MNDYIGGLLHRQHLAELRRQADNYRLATSKPEWSQQASGESSSRRRLVALVAAGLLALLMLAPRLVGG